MDSVFHTIKTILFIVLILYLPVISQLCLVPISVPNRSLTDYLQLTPIGAFAAHRPERSGIPAHLHTGIDIKRPTLNYLNEPIYPIASGLVISVRHDGPFAQVIIKHEFPETGHTWSVYEHIAGISCSPGDSVNPLISIARFMNRPELEQYGYQFDHLHLEILKQPPKPVLPSPELPDRFFCTYNLICYTEKDLLFYYINPLQFFIHHTDFQNTSVDGMINFIENLD
jgi:hypothetical protein